MACANADLMKSYFSSDSSFLCNVMAPIHVLIQGHVSEEHPTRVWERGKRGGESLRGLMGTIRSEFRSSIWLTARLPAILYLKTSLWPQCPPLHASPPPSLVPLPPLTPRATILPLFYLHASSWPGDPLGPCTGRGGPRGSCGPV